jgi:hypothetical protein
MANYYNQGSADAQDQPNYGSAIVRRVKSKKPVRVNMSAICFCLWVPWALFCIIYAVMSFSIHYKSKPMTYLIVLLGFVFVAMLGKKAVDDKMEGDNPDTHRDPNWSVFLAAACFIAWAAGIALGDLNYFYNLEPYYDVSQLNSYPKVDPSTTPGQQVMDAGRVEFVPGSTLEFNKSMMFRNLDMYCVVPIVKSDASRDNYYSYDFWAVGLNCCSSRVGKNFYREFRCGEYSNPKASSGLRVMRDDQRAFYRLAVQQAEAAYNIKANHPMFFFWMQDPEAEFHAYLDEGFKYYLFGLFAFFAFMLFLVLVAIFVLSKF